MAKERNSKSENFRVGRAGSGDGGMAGKGSVGATIGPRSATSGISGPSLGSNNVTNRSTSKFNHMGQAPYYDSGYKGSATKDVVRKPV